MQLNEIESIDKWFDGKYLTNVRKAMMEGKKLKECDFCYKAEALHGSSPRMGINQRYFAHNTDPEQKSIKKIDMKLGNKCNLKCKMCFPYASSELWKEWKQLGWNDSKKDPTNDTSWKY